MDFSEALLLMKDGFYLTREAWGQDRIVFIEAEEFVVYFGAGNEDWTPSSVDLLAEDWRVAD